MSKSSQASQHISLVSLLTGFFLLIIVFLPGFANGQISIGNDVLDIDYTSPVEYEIGGVTVSGVKYLDQNVLIMISGLTVGQKIKIPSDNFRNAIDKLWDQGLFEYVNITATDVKEDLVFLNIELRERPRLSKFTFHGVKKAEADNLREEIVIVRGDVLTENLLTNSRNRIKNYYTKKGYLDAEIDFIQTPDTNRANNVVLDIYVD
jgi:outer membrane protein insertion porin family